MPLHHWPCVRASPGPPRPCALPGVDVAHLCRNSGLCVDTGNTHFCSCQAGYTGSYCEEQVDECSPNPCQNGATCTDYLGGYSCEVRWLAASHRLPAVRLALGERVGLSG